jgi:hypothetical protein
LQNDFFEKGGVNLVRDTPTVKITSIPYQAKNPDMPLPFAALLTDAENLKCSLCATLALRLEITFGPMLKVVRRAYQILGLGLQ